MTYSCCDLSTDVSNLLADKGYRIHNGDRETGMTVDDESGADWWFTWVGAGRTSAEVGPTSGSSLQAEGAALAHFFGNALIPTANLESPACAVVARAAERAV